MSDPAERLRAQDRDRYIAALMADQPASRHLMALYDVDLELNSIAGKVSEPLAGEMRLQWWCDTIASVVQGGTTGSPVADALRPAIEAGKLPLSAFEQMIDARRFDLYGEIMRNEDELAEYCGAVFGIPIQLACLILSGGQDTASGTAAGHAGVVTGLLWVLENLGAHAARGHIYLPGDGLARHGVEPQSLLQGAAGTGLVKLSGELVERAAHRLGALGDAVARLDPALRPAFAQLATARSRIKAVKARSEVMAPAFGPSPVRRQWQIWRFCRSGRL